MKNLPVFVCTTKMQPFSFLCKKNGVIFFDFNNITSTNQKSLVFVSTFYIVNHILKKKSHIDTYQDKRNLGKSENLLQMPRS